MMNYRLSFTGGASPEINHLLTAIEHRLNGHVAMTMAVEDPPSSATEITIQKCGAPPLPPCTNSEPHGPWYIVAHGPALFYGTIALSFAAGFGVAMMLVGRKLKGR
jgi:hypothetical protein